MTSEQQKLFNVANHSNLGKEFEEELAAVHALYLRQGVVDVVQNPNAWDFARGREFHNYRLKFDKGERTAAKTGDGRYLMRVYSDVDFSGGNGRLTFCFDAKETKGERFPLSNIKPQQIVRLRQSARCGTIAGTLIKFSELDRVFFAPIVYLEKRFEQWTIASYGKRRAKPGVASVSISEFEQHGVEIFRHKNSRLWDWFAVLGGKGE